MYTLEEFTKSWNKEDMEICDGTIVRVSDSKDGANNDCIHFLLEIKGCNYGFSVLNINEHVLTIKYVLGDKFRKQKDVKVKCALYQGRVWAIYKDEYSLITPNEMQARAYDLGVEAGYRNAMDLVNRHAYSNLQ